MPAGNQPEAYIDEAYMYTIHYTIYNPYTILVQNKTLHTQYRV